ncbi:MAG: FtsW/RodA/SpoVE family cell cycle protein, partial [Clostridia bacterium]|nr:FtsW/RodA/SpoVE family cell cycle protein [Clostridia bacterium]
IWLGIGLLCLIASILWFNDYKKLANYKYLLAVIGAVALFLPIFIGIEQGGAKSWLDLKLFTLQPSEFVKIILVLFLASFLSENKFILNRKALVLQVWGPLLTMWGIGIILLVCQRDLGTALIYSGTFLTMLYMASSRIIYVLAGLVLFISGAITAGTIFSHVAIRYVTWINPWNYPQTEGYQILQSLYALGSGGLAGSGLGGGYPYLIPAVHTDFIFSALTEETGLLGAVGILILYLCLIYRGFVIALKAKDEFSSLLAGGLTALLGLQVFIITAGVIRLLPLTGVPLPYISYGGSSLVANMIIVGMLLNISAQNKEKP